MQVIGLQQSCVSSPEDLVAGSERCFIGNITPDEALFGQIWVVDHHESGTKEAEHEDVPVLSRPLLEEITCLFPRVPQREVVTDEG